MGDGMEDVKSSGSQLPIRK